MMSEDFIIPTIAKNLSLVQKKVNEEFNRLHRIIDTLEENNDKLRKKNDDLEGMICMLEEEIQKLKLNEPKD